MKLIRRRRRILDINQAVITAAGAGSRMKSTSSKPMTKVGDKKLIQYGIDVLLACGINKIHIIYSKYSEDVLQLKEKYKDINFVKQEIINGSLTTFNFIENVCKPPFLVLDCDIIFSQTDFLEMLKTIKDDDYADGYFAVVSRPMPDSPKYIKLNNNRIIDFNKNGFTDGYSGGMIYLWNNFPSELSKEFYKKNNSLGAFYNQLVKKEVIKAMFIKQLEDIDTMEDVIKIEKRLKKSEIKI